MPCGLVGSTTSGGLYVCFTSKRYKKSLACNNTAWILADDLLQTDDDYNGKNINVKKICLILVDDDDVCPKES